MQSPFFHILHFRHETEHELKEIKKLIMSTTNDVLAQIAAAKAAADANSAAVLAEIARVEAVIAALGTPGLTQAQIDQAVSDLQGVVTELGATTSAATAERP